MWPLQFVRLLVKGRRGRLATSKKLAHLLNRVRENAADRFRDGRNSGLRSRNVKLRAIVDAGRQC